MISVVIPTLNAVDRLGPCLGALAPAIADPMLREVILADGGSTDDVETAADGVGARLIAARPGRGGQLRAGCAAARGEWILILHADTRLSPDWVAAARRHMETSAGRAGWFRLAFDAHGLAPRLVERWANLRARRLALPYGDQGLLIRRDLYERVGGYPDIPLMEDVAIARALGPRRLAPIAAVATTSAERYLRDGWIRRGAGNLWTLSRYFAGVSPEALARDYQR